ncbi:uncharacterized protein LOC143027164 [Oratosquilla oratoria]|uniref:uncharacterized protein LOC143027164 n=1 Tax=Oratosquilla oratoria TaxID=337810 RepID=UPI003F765521
MQPLLLLPILVHFSLSVPILIPGAIVNKHGNTACVEDSIMVKMQISPQSLLNPLMEIRKDLFQIQQQISTQITNTTNQNNEISTTLYNNVNALHEKMNNIRDTIYHLPNPVTEITKNNRPKRGLFNFLGIISKSLFGTATEQDIQTVHSHMGNITKVLHQEGKLTNLNSKNIDLLATSINSVIDKINHLTTFTTSRLTKITQSQTALSLLHHLNELDKQLEKLIDHSNLVQSDIWNAHAGIVTSQMITPTQLTQTLRQAHNTLNLTPFFLKNEIQHYYPILASTIFQESILIHIPMDPIKIFSLWEIYPFPYPYQNCTMTLNMPTSTILKSTDGQWLTLTSLETMATCKTARPNFYICPAYPFHFQLTKSQPCLSELTTPKVNFPRHATFAFRTTLKYTTST